MHNATKCMQSRAKCNECKYCIMQRNAITRKMQKMQILHNATKCNHAQNAENAECSLECTIMRSNAMICAICNIMQKCKKCAWAKTTRIFGQESQHTRGRAVGIVTKVARGRGAPPMAWRGAPTSGSCRGTGTLTRGHPLSLVVGAAMPRRRIRRRRRAAPR